jgi:hypothetical protein
MKKYNILLQDQLLMLLNACGSTVKFPTSTVTPAVTAKTTTDKTTTL